MNKPFLLAVIACVAACPPAWAADHPPTRPTRDVDVVYQTVREIAGREQVLSQRTRWAVSLGKERVDPPTAGLYMLVDFKARKLMAVHPSQREVVVVDAGAALDTPGGASGGNFTPAGSDTVAGLACSEWSTRDASGQPTVVCLTPDGVLLRATSGNHVLVEATAVSYGAMDPALFDPPAGFKRLSPGDN